MKASLLFLLFLSLPVLHAQDAPALVSGPAPDTALTPVPCYATDGPLAGITARAIVVIDDSRLPALPVSSEPTLPAPSSGPPTGRPHSGNGGLDPWPDTNRELT